MNSRRTLRRFVESRVGSVVLSLAAILGMTLVGLAAMRQVGLWGHLGLVPLLLEPLVLFPSG